MITSEAERALDAALAGPLPEEIGRSLVEHQVIERVAAEMAERAAHDGLNPALTAWAATDETRELLATVTIGVTRSPAFKEALREVLSSREIRVALASQSTGFGEEIASATRSRVASADRRLDERAPGARLPGFGGFTARAVALVVDALLAELAFAVLASAVALVLGLAGGFHPSPLGGALAGAAWFLATMTYFVTFWTAAGQTPGMRLMHVRVATHAGAPPSAIRSLVRFTGLILAIIPLFAGFLPALFDSRRRALPDFLSGTVVLDDDRKL